jgi:hypothetical protein
MSTALTMMLLMVSVTTGAESVDLFSVAIAAK